MTSGPFFRGAFQVDLLAGAEALVSAYAQDAKGVVEALQFVEKGIGYGEIPASDALPPGFLVYSESYIWVCLTGTQTYTQQILNIVGSAQASLPPIPGRVGVYWGNAAIATFDFLRPKLDEIVPGRKVVLLGHSLGGALCEIMVSLFSHRFSGVPIACFTYGAPRPGDPVFAAAVGAAVTRVEAPDDPVPAIPPVIWAGPGSVWPIPGPPPFDTYAHPGNAITIDSAGTISAGSDPMGVVQAALTLAQGATEPHAITEYARRLNAQIPPEELTVDVSNFEHPQFLQPNLDDLLGVTSMATPGAGLPPAINKVYLTYNYGEVGIGEEFYSTLAPSVLRTKTIPNYLKYRMQMAVPQFTFVYARISNPSTPRWVDFVTANDKGVTKTGQLGQASNIKSLPSSGSEDDGALLSRMKLQGGPSAKQFLHAFDQTMTDEGVFTPNSTWNRAYAAYMAFLQDASNGVQFKFGPAKPTRLAITAIAAKPIRGFTITCAVATTVQTGDTIYVGGTGRSIIGVTGRKIVTSVAAGGLSFDVGGASPVGEYNGVGGFYYPVFTAAAPGTLGTVDYMQIERLTAHKVGRPFAEPRGRKQALLSLRL